VDSTTKLESLPDFALKLRYYKSAEEERVLLGSSAAALLEALNSGEGEDLYVKVQ
jgi:hypothetical protein